MSDISAKSFLALLQKSKLCESDELKASLSELSRKANGKPIKLDQLTSHLLDDGLISEWHIKKLVNGKYKGFFLGKYKLLRLLGTGGMSTVYLAQHTIFDQQRAIKVLPRNRVADKTYLERFFREGRAAAALNDKNIVRVYDIGNEADTHYLVMEYVKGKDIYQMVNESGPLPFDLAIDYMIQALTGLQHAHETDLVHRDVKPANLLVTEDGVVKLLDLGLALFQEDDSSLTVMHNERVLGTADYLSPEQAVDSHNLDHRSDIYSAGCTLYFMLTGKPPFFEGTLAQRIAKHQSCEPQPISDFRPDCPDEVMQLVRRMMKKNPVERFQSCEDAVIAFRAVSEILLLNGTSAPSIAASEMEQVATQPGVPATPITVEKTVQSETPSQPKVKEKPKAKVQSRLKPASKADAKPKAKPKPKAAVHDKNVKKPVDQPIENPTPAAKPALDKRGSEKPGAPRQLKQVAKPKSKEANRPNSAGQKNAQKSDAATAAVNRATRPTKKETAKKDVRSNVTKAAAEPLSEKQSNEPKRERETNPQPAAAKQPKPQQQRQAVSVGRKPAVDATSVSVIVKGDDAAKNAKSENSIVGVRELNQFVTQTRNTTNQTARLKRNPVKNQLLIAGMVIGMLALLGLIILIAMWAGS